MIKLEQFCRSDVETNEHRNDGPIPADLMERLLDMKPLLIKQGCVQRHYFTRAGKVYRLRFRDFDEERGYRVQQSLPLGDEETARAVEELIQRWREEHKAEQVRQKQVKRLLRATRQARRAVVQRAKETLVAFGVPCGYRRWALAAFEDALERGDGPLAVIRLSEPV